MEIIPNWHPVLVHFTIALVSVSFGFMVLPQIFPASRWAEQWRSAARWNLWAAAIITVATVAAGVHAFSTVDHDDLAHKAMLEHRAWALTTAAALWAVAAWAVYRFRKNIREGYGLLLAMAVLVGLVASTGWHGAELVYRHGLGVMRLPSVVTHSHEHASGLHDPLAPAGAATAAPSASNPSAANSQAHPHDHAAHPHD